MTAKPPVRQDRRGAVREEQRAIDIAQAELLADIIAWLREKNFTSAADALAENWWDHPPTTTETKS